MLLFWVLYREDTGIEKSKKAAFLIFWFLNFWFLSQGQRKPRFPKHWGPSIHGVHIAFRGVVLCRFCWASLHLLQGTGNYLPPLPGVRADFQEGDEDSNFSVFRVRRFSEWPAPLHRIVFPVEILTKPLIHWVASPLSTENPFSSLKSASSHPLPKNRLWWRGKQRTFRGNLWLRGNLWPHPPLRMMWRC